jgi:ceramide glucosyltransferase
VDTLPLVLAVLACAGLVQVVAGWFAVRRFVAAPAPMLHEAPPVTILKPLHGAEPMLEQALASVCQQHYPNWQVVFGVQSAADPALPVAERLRARFPACDIAVVVDAAAHGENRKVGNLINMFRVAKHDVLVIADSDVHCAPDFLERVAATLALPDTGLVTTLYAGLAATDSLPARLGASWITHCFLPGALIARWLGRQDCLGATMTLRRETLAAIGGLQALADHLADDHVLGRLVQACGLAVRLASTVPATTVGETALPALFRHELRWGRTIRALAPVAFALSALQYPLFWAALAVIVSGMTYWAVAAFLLAWVVRAAAARGVDAALGLARAGLATPAPVWLLPLRDLMSVVVLLASHWSDRVEWRGQVLHAASHRGALGVGRS